MARNVQVGVTAKLGNLQGGAAFVKSLQRQLRATSFTINIGISRNSSQAINGITARLNNYSQAAQLATARTTSLASAVQNLSNIFSNFAINANTGVAALKQFNTAAKGTSSASKHIQTFSNRFELLGDRVALSAKRFGAFALAARPLIALSNAIGEATSEAIQFQDQMVRLSQIVGTKTIKGVSDVANQIQSLSVKFGVASKDITSIADTFLQAGLTANKLTYALEAVTKVALAPTFDSIEQAGEGLIAMMGQFNISADQFGKRLSQINTLSAKYAAESSDYITAIRKSGAAFAGAGGSLEELMALFTAVRDSSRESADTISTSFRTIFARLQRPGTVNFLEQLGVQLRDVKGNFVGPFQAVLNIADKLSKINPRSQLFSQIVEEIGGIRQVNKVQTLLAQTAKAREALSVAQNAGNSIDEDADKRQQSLIVNLTRLNEAFKNLFKTLATDSTFTATANSLLKLATSAVQAVEQIAPLIPLIAGFSALTITNKAMSFGLGAVRRAKAYSGGGQVPGSGNRDSEMAMLMPGEFVVNKKAVKAIGVENLHRLNEGRIGKYARGTPRRKPKTYSSFQEMTKDVVDQMPRYSAETKRRIAETLGAGGRQPLRTRFEIGDQGFTTGSQMAQSYGAGKIGLTDQSSIVNQQTEAIEEEVKVREQAVKATKKGSDAIKAETRENERLSRQFSKATSKNINRRLADRLSGPSDSWYSQSSYNKLVAGNQPRSSIVAGDTLMYSNTSTPRKPGYSLQTRNDIRVPRGGFHAEGEYLKSVQQQLQASKNQLLLPYYPANTANGVIYSGGKSRNIASASNLPPSSKYPVNKWTRRSFANLAGQSFVDSDVRFLQDQPNMRSTYGELTTDEWNRANSQGRIAIARNVNNTNRKINPSAVTAWVNNRPTTAAQRSAYFQRSVATLSPAQAAQANQMWGSSAIPSAAYQQWQRGPGGPNNPNYPGGPRPPGGGGGGGPPHRPITLARRFNRLRSTARLGISNFSNNLDSGRVGAGLALAGLAASQVFSDTTERRNVLGAGLTGGLTSGGSVLALTGNPLLAVGAGAAGAYSSVSGAKADNFNSAARRQLSGIVGASNTVSGKQNDFSNLYDIAKLYTDGSLESTKSGFFDRATAAVSTAISGDNSVQGRESVQEGYREDRRRAFLQTIKEPLESEAGRLEEFFKDRLSRGQSLQEIGKSVNLKNAAIVLGAARSTDAGASSGVHAAEGMEALEKMARLTKPVADLEKAFLDLASQVENDSQAFRELASNVGLIADSTNLLVSSSKVLAGGLGQVNLGGESNIGIALNGNLNNRLSQKALKNELGAFGGTGKKLADQLIGADVSQKILSDIFTSTLQGTSDTYDIGKTQEELLKDFATRFQKSTGRGLDTTLENAIRTRLDEAISDTDTTATFKRKALDPGFAKSLLQDVDPENEAHKQRLLESSKRFADSFADILDQATENIDKRFEMVQKGATSQANIELMKRQFAKNDFVDVGLSQQVFMQGQKGLLGRAGINANPLDGAAIVAGRDALRRSVEAAEGRVSNGPAEDRLKNIEELKKLNDALGASEKAVSNLTDNIDELNKGPLERLAQIGQEKNARLGFGEKLLGGNATDAMRQLQRIMAAQGAVAQGNFNNMNPMQRRMALEGLNDMSGMRVNGRLVDDIKADLIKNSLPGLIPKDMEAEEKTLQKQVIDNLGIQATSINANIVSLDQNSQAIWDNTLGIQNMVTALQQGRLPAGFAGGGRPQGTDTVPAMLTPGEFVINRRATEKFLPLLHQINSGGLDIGDVQYAARGRRMRGQGGGLGAMGPRVIDELRAERRKNRGIVSRAQRMANRRGLDVAFFSRQNEGFRGHGERAPLREFNRNQRIVNFQNMNNGPTRYSRAAGRRLARQGRLAMRGYADGGMVDGGGGGGIAFDAAAISQFVSASAALTQALNNIPREISLVGSYSVNIIHNGLDIVGELQPMVQRMVDDGLRKANRSYRGMSDPGESETFGRLDGGM
jgi:TP901 family phage tail tape measure protein